MEPPQAGPEGLALRWRDAGEGMRYQIQIARSEDFAAPAVDAQTGIPTQTVLGPDRVTIIEKWASVEALKAHSVAPHMKAYRERVKDYVRGMDLRVLSPA